MELTTCDINLKLLPEKAIYIDQFKSLLVSDIHLGKSETFQRAGIPIPNAINAETLDRLQNLCLRLKPDHLFILGDLLHSKFALVDEVLNLWFDFLQSVEADVSLIIGNHDRYLTHQLEKLSIHYFTDAIQIENLILSHEPSPQAHHLNICGHIHPCLNIKTKLDRLRLPCFYFDQIQHLLVLPSFGEFTGGYEVELTSSATAYVIAEDVIIPFQG
ncbi:ligase-associated DNA damage response endonuclease PdeM [Oscillatoria sp. FACHB-1407]|uniref:ligase-associated DNA damage response endonuclease PdeM n=1 Tax=Oscillatoria sp. FACHB-1407 TaxID=2692847 RepID=UPI0016852C1D|nr:ligase-associated DNA damage response endonuclease PdeM [Oscillatoria sp. FACHB-1407]MBD2460514.1 ligase-associated DNA damage response endonuclease PdeM [Oscillatoria sp. FACHB-1407]